MLLIAPTTIFLSHTRQKKGFFPFKLASQSRLLNDERPAEACTVEWSTKFSSANVWLGNEDPHGIHIEFNNFNCGRQIYKLDLFRDTAASTIDFIREFGDTPQLEENVVTNANGEFHHFQCEFFYFWSFPGLFVLNSPMSKKW